MLTSTLMISCGMFMELKKKLDTLKDFFHGKKVIVAFSGGADSTLLALIAKNEAKDSLAVTVDNGVMPPEFMKNAQEIAQKIGINHLVIQENFLDDLNFRTNPPNRCYICRKKMYQQLEKLLSDYCYDFVVDGTNISDLMEDRPGTLVNIEKNIKTPLVRVGLTSEEVRAILHKWRVNYNPSTTCLATRIPTRKTITPQKINRINYAENFIRNLTSLDVVRVRDDDGVAYIEVGDVDKLQDNVLLDSLNFELKKIGFEKVDQNIGSYADSKKETVVYRPCKSEKNRIILEIELPYQLNILDTCHELESLGEVKCSPEMGIVRLEFDGLSITLFAKGKIVARGLKDQKDGKKLLTLVLPCIRRQR